ncbi:MAG: S8 family serine peptidase [Bdellovibrionales bacterium]|nr:S8 family serine peptidase [Bdellovibrionales bacterium]
MSHLPPNKGSKVLSAAVVMAILGSSSAMARIARVEPGVNAYNTGTTAYRTYKGDFYRGDASSFANQSDLWATSEAKTDKDEGTSTDKLYAALKEMGLSTDKEIIVAVLDSGVDITHEDLEGHIWTNPGETGLDANGKDKATNGKDDDGDGFIDDVHGWNFIGAVKDGKNVNSKMNTLERTREYGRLKKLVAAGSLPATDAYYLAVKNNYETTIGNYPGCEDTEFRASDLIGDKEEELQAVCASDSMKGSTSCLQTSYGNNDVGGHDADGKVMDSHGTHVAGIIAAVRDNEKGIQGQATNVKIMPIRAVPGCDERDKDIANGIRFAVDHGAKVINMSFGKNFSPHKDWVDAAVAYAQSKGVLLVHAAGNEGSSNEGSRSMIETRMGNFPNQFHFDAEGKPTEVAANWIEVGASTRHDHEYVDYRYGPVTLAAPFSNYGKTAVDLFAPGFTVKSSIPGNQYASYDGTSMASPETAGVAALLMSIFPEANYASIRKAMIMNTSPYAGLTVRKPMSDAEQAAFMQATEDAIAAKKTPPKVPMILFTELSASGGIVNAYEAAKALKAERSAGAARASL